MARTTDEKTDPRLLASVLDLESEGPLRWHASELAAVLRHQLGAPIRPDLEKASPDLARRFDAATAGSPGAAALTFGSLLTDPAPPLELLQLAKDFAKKVMGAPDVPLPDEVATVLYYAAIAPALLRHNQRITGLTDDALRQGVTWAVSLDWVGDPIRPLFEQVLTRL